MYLHCTLIYTLYTSNLITHTWQATEQMFNIFINRAYISYDSNHILCFISDDPFSNKEYSYKNNKNGSKNGLKKISYSIKNTNIVINKNLLKILILNIN